MSFILRLTENYNDFHLKTLEGKGYKVTFEDSILPDLIIVEKDNGSQDELLELDFISEANLPRIGKIDSQFERFK